MLVTVDTLRADHLGCYGDTGAHTPTMDTVAERGVRFDAAQSPVPLTLPAHASLMTGVEPPRHAVRHNSIHRLGPELPTLAERLRAAGFATAAFVGALVLDARFGLDRGFDVYDDRSSGRVSGDTGYAERPADAVVDAALAWLETAPERFFLWVHFYDPHASYDPPPGFAAAFAARPYDGEIAFVDAELGRLLAGLGARFGEEGLALLVTSDHGEGLGEHGEPTHSYTLYQGTQRIPLLLAGPGVPAGRVVAAPVDLHDVAPTLLAMAGAEPLPASRGRDLRSLPADAPPRPLHLETLATALDFGWSPLVGVREGRWKYLRAPRPELYDLADDPGERRNLASERTELTARLDAVVAQRLAEAAEPLPVQGLDERDREALRSLGYVVSEAAPGSEADASAAPDPKDRIHLLRNLGRAQAALARGDGAEAQRELSAFPESPPVVRAHRAAAALAAGDPAGAERQARLLLAAEPGRSDLRILLARALRAQGRPEDAARALAALPPDVSPAPWVALEAAEGDLLEGRPATAAERLRRAGDRHPGEAGLRRAREAVDRLLADAQERGEAPVSATDSLEARVLLRLARGDREGARALLESALPGARGEIRVHLEALRAETSPQGR